VSPSLVMLLDEPQASPHVLLHCCARSTRSVALIVAPALRDAHGGRILEEDSRIRPQPWPNLSRVRVSPMRRTNRQVHHLAEERRAGVS
jgi:hypothetical protein